MESSTKRGKTNRRTTTLGVTMVLRHISSRLRR
jgi:hypothetical protein